jgi:PAS domain S-box-containing protein
MAKANQRQARATKAVLEASMQDTARLEALFASIGEGVIATDEAGNITRVNKKALSLLNMTETDVIHKHFLDAVVSVHDNGEPVSAFERPIVKAFQTGRTISSRMFYQQKDGALLPVYLTVSPIIYRGRPIGAIEVFRDLTDEIESDKLKSDFISIASHQLRTPLSAINMYSMMLRDGLAGELTGEQLAYVHTILTSVARIEAGGIKPKMTPVRLDDLAREMLIEFMPAAQAKELALSTELSAGMAAVRTDGMLVKEVCANLLSNAIKYTPEGGSVTLRLTETPKEIRWAVTDTGYGIPEGEQKNIFLKFFRAGNIVSKDVSGTGLGLYLIKNIAESLGGDLWFESTENIGSTFYFSLPKDPG